MASFAKAQLMKYGWTEGKGLGRNENGITEALRPKLKFDTTGIGHKETDSNQWWEAAFNKAANNLTVESQSNGGVSFSVIKKDESQESPLQNSKKKTVKNTSQYQNFLKTSTLCDGNLIQEKIDETTEVKDIEKDVIHIPLSDAELFKACGGRTMHASARYGLKLSGKLDRIAQQDKIMEKRKRGSGDDENDGDSTLPSLGPDTRKVTYSAKKRIKRQIDSLSHKLGASCSINENDAEMMDNDSGFKTVKKKKHRKRGKSRDKKSSNSDAAGSCIMQDINNEIYDIPLPARKHTQKMNTKEKNRGASTSKVQCEGHVSDVKGKRSQSCQDRITVSTQLEEEGTNANQSHKSKKSHSSDQSDCPSDTVHEGPPCEWDSKSFSFSKMKAKQLNALIKKKKDARLRKKIKRKLQRVLDGEESTDTGKHKTKNVQKKMETIVKDADLLISRKM